MFHKIYRVNTVSLNAWLWKYYALISFREKTQTSFAHAFNENAHVWSSFVFILVTLQQFIGFFYHLTASKDLSWPLWIC